MARLGSALLGAIVLVHVPCAVPLRADDDSATETQKIEGLIKHLEGLQDAKFVRNGREYDSAAAGSFVRSKWKANSHAIRTAADFVEKAASVSSTTGKPYLIRFKDGREVASRDYLIAQLKGTGRLEPKLAEGAAFRVGEPLARKEQKPDRSVTAIAFSPDGKRLVIGDDKGWVSEVETRHGKKTNASRVHDSPISAIAFRPGPATYFTAAKSGEVAEWIVAGRQRFGVQVDRDKSLSFPSIAVCPNGKRLAVGGRAYGSKDSVRLYDADSGKQLLALEAGSSTTSVEFSKDGNFLLCLNRDEARIMLWDVSQAELVWSREDERARPDPPTDANFLSGVAFGPGEGEYAYSLSQGRDAAVICICDLKTGTVRKEITSKRGGDQPLAVSPDGKWVAISQPESIVEIWDATTGKPVRSFAGDQDHISRLAFSPDGRFLASASSYGSVIVWDTSSIKTRSR